MWGKNTMTQRRKRKVAILLVFAMLIFGIQTDMFGPARSAAETMVGMTRSASETPKYLLVRTSGSSDSSWNDLHYLYPKSDPSKQYVAYCLESHKSSPLGQTYSSIGSPNFSAAAERGLKTIFRLGYPYSNVFGDTGEYRLNNTDAQAATQIAIRFWMAYRQSIDTDRDYHVIRSLNPKNGTVKAADTDSVRRSDVALR